MRELLAQIGWSQKFFSQKIGVSEKTVWRWCKESPNPVAMAYLRYVVKMLPCLLILWFPQSEAVDRDKRDHAIAGSLISISMALSTGDWKIGALSGCGAGLVKEWVDQKNYGGFDVKDLGYTCAGSLLGAGVVTWLK